MAKEAMSEMELRCLSDKFACCKFDDEGLVTSTSKEQKSVEKKCADVFSTFKTKLEIFPDIPLLERCNHKEYLLRSFDKLSSSFECLDASRPWLCYWILHGLDLLGHQLYEDEAIRAAVFLEKCQSPTGGFGGGPGQFAHLATTYAAVNALSILAKVTKKVLEYLNRQTLYTFLMAMRDKSDLGAFKMHEGGEIDIRGAYCAASVACLTNICTQDLFADTADWIVKCQTYEGGFGGCPGLEAHGGYSFCGLAALLILNFPSLCNLQQLLRWTAMRQMKYEGGFQGRTNKLVDGCYSFWQAAIFPIMHMVLRKADDTCLSMTSWMFDQQALQEYILICCQEALGGLMDKPGKRKDQYHSCYCLSGLSVAQHCVSDAPSPHPFVVGDMTRNLVEPINPLFNVTVNSVMAAYQYFSVH